MHKGIFAVPVCIRGLILIPICIRGSHVMLSPNAYGDHDVIPVCIRGFARSPYAFVVLHGANCHRSRRQWRSSSNVAAVDIVGGNGGLSPQRSLSTEAAVGWSRRRRSSSLTAAAKAPSPPHLTMTAIAAAVDERRPLASGGHRRRMCGSGDGGR